MSLESLAFDKLISNAIVTNNWECISALPYNILLKNSKTMNRYKLSTLLAKIVENTTYYSIFKIQELVTSIYASFPQQSMLAPADPQSLWSSIYECARIHKVFTKKEVIDVINCWSTILPKYVTNEHLKILLNARWLDEHKCNEFYLGNKSTNVNYAGILVFRIPFVISSSNVVDIAIGNGFRHTNYEIHFECSLHIAYLINAYKELSIEDQQLINNAFNNKLILPTPESLLKSSIF